jgi:hypothetical protein
VTNATTLEWTAGWESGILTGVSLEFAAADFAGLRLMVPYNYSGA